jgi:hypothetical protein
MLMLLGQLFSVADLATEIKASSGSVQPDLFSRMRSALLSFDWFSAKLHLMLQLAL